MGRADGVKRIGIDSLDACCPGTELHRRQMARIDEALNRLGGAVPKLGELLRAKFIYFFGDTGHVE